MPRGLRHRAAAHAVAALGRLAARDGLAEGIEGNASVRRGDDLFISAANAALAVLGPRDVAHAPLDPAAGPGGARLRPSKDVVAHRALYRAHPSAGAVLHVHGRYVAAFCALREDHVPVMSSALALQVALPISILDYAEPRVLEREDAYAHAARVSPVLLQRNHGLYVAAEDGRAAVRIAAAIESNLRSFFLATATGRQVAELTPEQVDRLQRSRVLMTRIDGAGMARAAARFPSESKGSEGSRAAAP